jgi:UDP:flavonoid glycosyltransferase YjiC (YdhE family)
MAPNESHKSTKKPKKTILVAPLHWGLGHATRCIPLIESLVENGYDVLLGSDGAALMFLQKEFPELPSLTLRKREVLLNGKCWPSCPISKKP